MDARTTWPGLLSALLAGEDLTADETAWAMERDHVRRGHVRADRRLRGGAAREGGDRRDEVTGLVAHDAGRMPPPLDGRADPPSTSSAPAATGRTRSTSRPWRRWWSPAPGARVVKHGNRAASSACGAADLLEDLGVVARPAARRRWPTVRRRGGHRLLLRAASSTRRCGTRRAPRRELGVPTVFNFLGPLTNPARPAAQAIGVRRPADGRR